MSKKIVAFRRINHGELRRLKVLVEDMTSSRTVRVSVLAIVLAAIMAFGVGYLEHRTEKWTPVFGYSDAPSKR